MIALIPARGGSKRLPRKNIREFCGQPLINYSIAMAQALPEVERTIVSTDDPQIAEVARAWGAEVMMRPPELATDEAKTVGVVRHVLSELARHHYEPVGVVLLQPNCPLRPYALVRAAIDAFLSYPVDSVVSVTQSREKAGHIAGGLFHPAYRPGTRSQDMPPAYFENGVVYVSRANMVREAGDLFGPRIYPLVTDPIYALGDIDTELDFQIAEHLFRTHREHFVLPARHEPTTRKPCAHLS